MGRGGVGCSHSATTPRYGFRDKSLNAPCGDFVGG